MPRTLSPALVQQKNQLGSVDPFLWLMQVDSPDFPAPIRLVNDVQSIIYQGMTYLPFPFEFSAVQENALGEKQSLSLTTANVDRQVISLLNSYWDSVVDPHWEVKLWQALRSDPDEVPSSHAEVFEVLSVETESDSWRRSSWGPWVFPAASAVLGVDTWYQRATPTSPV